MENTENLQLFYGSQAVKNYLPTNFLKEYENLFCSKNQTAIDNNLFLCILDAKGKVKSPFKFSPEFLILLREQQINAISFKNKGLYHIVLKNYTKNITT